MPTAFNRSFISNAALFIFFIFVGTGAGLLLCWWEAFKFKPSITLGQVVQTCVLLLIFLLANHLYAKSHDRRKKKIEILVDMAGGILTQVEQVHVSFLRWTDPVSVRMRRDLDSALTDYSNAVRELEEVLKYFQQFPGADALEELKRNRNDYKDLVTESPYPISMPDQRITQEARIHTKIRSHLRYFQMQLSDY